MSKETDFEKSMACPVCGCPDYEPRRHYKFYGTSHQRQGPHLVIIIECKSCECRFHEVYKVEFVEKKIQDNPPLCFIHDYEEDAPKHFTGYACNDCQIVWKDYYGEHKNNCPYCNSTDIVTIAEC